MDAARQTSESDKQLSRQTLPKCKRLASNRQFKAVLDQRRRATDQILTLFVAPNDCSYARLGVSVGRSCGKAVARNCLKRMLREAFRSSQAQIPSGFDYVLMIAGALAKRLKDPKRGRKVLATLTTQQFQRSFLTLVETTKPRGGENGR